MRILRRFDPNSRRRMALANAALAAGLALWLFVHPAGSTARAARDATAGFLLGLSIAANLFLVFKARRTGTDC